MTIRLLCQTSHHDLPNSLPQNQYARVTVIALSVLAGCIAVTATFNILAPIVLSASLAKMAVVTAVALMGCLACTGQILNHCQQPNNPIQEPQVESSRPPQEEVYGTLDPAAQPQAPYTDPNTVEIELVEPQKIAAPQ